MIHRKKVFWKVPRRPEDARISEGEAIDDIKPPVQRHSEHLSAPLNIPYHPRHYHQLACTKNCLSKPPSRSRIVVSFDNRNPGGARRKFSKAEQSVSSENAGEDKVDKNRFDVSSSANRETKRGILDLCNLANNKFHSTKWPFAIFPKLWPSIKFRFSLKTQRYLRWIS